MSPIPPVLLAPPWRAVQSKAPIERAPRDETSSVARLRWEPGERERFRGPAVKLVAPPADERLFDELMDFMDLRRSLPLAEVRRLSDESLRELANELPAELADSAIVRLLLARLGDDFVERAVELVKSARPEKGMFEAAAPLETPSLACAAVAHLPARRYDVEEAMQRTFVPKPQERWLERHAAVAVRGLIADALDPDASRHKSALLGVQWIAARCGERTGNAALDEQLAAFRALAPLSSREGLSWLAVLAALGLDRQAIALLDQHPAPEAAPWVARIARTTARDAAVAWLEAHRAEVEPVLASSGGEDASIALRVLEGDETAGDPAVRDVPDAIPPLPQWLELDALPAPRLKHGQTLPADCVLALAEMLRFTSLSRPYRGLDQVNSACDAASLDAFARGLLHAWTAHGQEPGDRWALDACGAVGGNECASEVADMTRGWARAAHLPERGWDPDERRVVTFEEGDRNWNYTLTACEVLRAMGTELSLTVLDDLANNASQAWLRRYAKQTLGDALEGKKMRREAFDDAIVPDLGLGANGSMTLDLGTRSCRVAFDEKLTPLLVDDDGKRLKSFPRSRKTDDPEKYAAARERYAALRRDVTVLARQQIAQLERAMCRQCAWTKDAFEARFVTHLLLRHLAMRLVWHVADDERTFRIAEDSTLAGPDDAELALDVDAKVTLAHPAALLPEVMSRWTAVFQDYEILQPFQQLHREVFPLHDADCSGTRLPRFVGGAVRGGKLFAIKRRGWSSRDGGSWSSDLSGGATATFCIRPSFVPGCSADDTFELTDAWCTHSLSQLSRIDYSELVRDLTYLVAD